MRTLFAARLQTAGIVVAGAMLLAASLPHPLAAQGLPTAAPEDVGLSSERLSRITETFQKQVDAGEAPGVVVVIARNGKIAYDKAIGFQNREDKIAMKPDTIFRIASMSKPITSVAIMMLAEEAKIDLVAPVAAYLPEFKDLKVGAQGEAVKRPMTVQDLLRHTSGLVYEFFAEDPVVKQAYHDAGVFNFNQTLAEMVTRLSRLPLGHQPGSTWDYGMSTDVLGRIVEVASGQSLDEFVAERIAKPLKLENTGFSISEAQVKSLAEPQVDSAAGKRPAMIVDNLTTKPKWLSGGGGMVSTATDYVRFCQMLLNGGALDGARLLSPKTVTLMTSDHLPPGVAYNTTFTALLQDQAPTPEMGEGFGLGFLVRTDAGRNPFPGSVGDYSWSGAHGTHFWVDPKEKLVAVLMVQNAFDQGGLIKSAHYRQEMRALVYQAVTGPPSGANGGATTQ